MIPPVSAEVPTSLTAAWAGRDDFTLLDTAFGDGAHFAAVRRAWRTDPARPRRLHYMGVTTAVPVQPPPDVPDRIWPPPLRGWHVLDLGPDDVQLTLAVGDARTVARGLDCRADAFALDGFAPGPAAWPAALLDALARLAAPGAIGYTTAPLSLADPTADAGLALRAALRRAGFVATDDANGTDIDTDTASPPGLRLRHAPRATVRPAPARGGAPGHAVIVGAGLAGAWAAHALRRQGWTITVLDRRPGAAQEASGNPAGLFHGTVLADDGPHARLHRAAALLAARTLAPWVTDEQRPGRVDGLLRLAGDGDPSATLQAMQALIARHALPPGYVQALDAASASARAGIPLDRPAWFHPGGGWVDPRALVQHLLAGAALRFDADVAALQRAAGRWQLLDARGETLAVAGTVVLANAADAARLWPDAGWPLGRSRGQISQWPQVPAGAPRPRVPVSGGGYLLATGDGGLLCGASAAAGDADPALRDTDHHFNLARLRRLTGWDAPWPPQGRVGWRATTPDRLPLVGPVPATQAGGATRLDRLPREAGLFVLSGLGSRGLTWGPLLGRVLAAWITGAPMPVEASLRDAIDPARWQVRAARRAGRSGPVEPQG